MREDNVLYIGDKIELVKGKGRVYKTMVEDIIEGVSYLVGVPSYGGIPMLLHDNDDVIVVFYRDSGRYIVPVKVLAIEKKGEVRYAHLLLKTQPHRDQRREAFRVPVRIRMLICEHSDEIEKKLSAYEDITDVVTLETVASKDISVSGISFITKREYMLGEKYMLKLHLADTLSNESPFIICAEIVRISRAVEANTYNIGMHFFGQSRPMVEKLSKYMLAQQQKQIKQRRLISE